MAAQHIFEVELPNGEIIEVEAPEDTPQEQITARVAAFRNQRAGIKNVDAMEGMGRGEKFLAGIGRSADTSIKGAKQLGTSLASYFVNSNPMLFSEETRKGFRDSLSRQEAEETERRRLDAPLMRDGYGMAGNIAGTVGQIVAPGGVAKLATMTPRLMKAAPAAGRLARLVQGASLPSTAGGAAAQGAVIGAAQPMATGENRLASMAINAGAGYGGAKIGQAVGGIVRGGVRGLDRRVGETLTQEADDVANLMRPQPSQVPGVTRSLAEESKDAGIARLERGIRDTTVGWRARDLSNNAARVAAIRQFAGDESSIRAAEEARDAATSGLRDRAFAEGSEAAKADAAARALMMPGSSGMGSLRTGIRSIAQAKSGNPAVQSALSDVDGALAKAGDSVGGLYDVRQYIGFLLSGKAGSDKSYARAASAELIRMRGMIDEEIAKRAPTFPQYIKAYSEASTPINRMQVGQELIGQKAGSNTLDELGNQVLLPNKFSGMARDLDGVAQRATGFDKASAASILQPDDFATIAAVQDDLERQAFRQSASGSNSHTYQRKEIGKRMVNRTATNAAARAVPLLGGGFGAAMDYLEKVGAQRLSGRLAEVIQNPQQARAILANMPPPERAALEEAIKRLGAGGTVPAVAAARSPEATLEIDVVGGTPISDDEFEREFGFRPR